MHSNETLSSTFHDIKLEITGTEEPNNGRMLRIVNLIIDGQDLTTKYFRGWNRINYDLDRYVMDSPDGKFIYISAESCCFLIDCNTLEKINLPSKSLSAATFIGNSFSNNKLLIIHCDEIVIINLQSFVTTKIGFPKGIVRWAELDSDNELFITYLNKDLNTLTKERFDIKHQIMVHNVS